MISVVIVSYNTIDLLQACLVSLQKQTAELKIIVVDNASTDGSAAMLRERFPEVTLIANDTNRGFAAGNNQGFTSATGEYILMLNGDTEIPDRDGLERLAIHLHQHQQIGVIAPRLINSDRSVQQSASWNVPNLWSLVLEYTLLNRMLDKLFATRKYPGKVLLSRQELSRSQTVADLLGACLLFRRSLVHEVGLLDERFFIFYEETDFNLRVRRAGYQLCYFPDVTVLHHWGSSVDAGQGLARRMSYGFPSLYTFLHKHRGRAYAAATQLVVGVLSTVTRLGLYALLPLAVLVDLLFARNVRRGIKNQLLVTTAVSRWHLGKRSARPKPTHQD